MSTFLLGFGAGVLATVAVIFACFVAEFGWGTDDVMREAEPKKPKPEHIPFSKGH